MNKKRIICAKELSVGEVAARCGVAVSTLHYYESIGLIRSWRNAGNQRRYPREVMRHVAIIKVAQKAGMSLDTIRESFAGLQTGQKITLQEWRKISAQWRDDIDRRITLLMHLRDDLDQCIGCGCLSRTDCPLRNPNDAAGRSGTGARFIDTDS